MGIVVHVYHKFGGLPLMDLEEGSLNTCGLYIFGFLHIHIFVAKLCRKDLSYNTSPITGLLKIILG